MQVIKKIRKNINIYQKLYLFFLNLVFFKSSYLFTVSKLPDQYILIY